MLKQTAAVILACLTLAACASSQPRVIQSSTDMPEVHLSTGMATQIELPEPAHAQSVIVGNAALVTAEKDGDVVNLTAKDGAGETNLIIRSVDDSGHHEVYQYRVVVMGH